MRFAAITAATSAVAPRLARAATTTTLPPALFDPDAFASDIAIGDVTDLTD